MRPLGHRDLGRQRGASLAGRHRRPGGGIATIASSPAGGSIRVTRAARADDESAVQRCGEVVGVAFDQQSTDASRSVPSSKMWSAAATPGEDRRRARPEATGQRDLGGDPEGEVVGAVQRLEGLDDQVVLVRRDVEVGLDRELAGLFTSTVSVSDSAPGEHVEARSEVGRTGRNPDDAAAVHQPSTAFSSWPISGSHGITDPTLSNAVSGSFKPLPVRMQTTFGRPPSARGARGVGDAVLDQASDADAADAGSQKTPSLAGSHL